MLNAIDLNAARKKLEMTSRSTSSLDRSPAPASSSSRDEAAFEDLTLRWPSEDHAENDGRFEEKVIGLSFDSTAPGADVVTSRLSDLKSEKSVFLFKRAAVELVDHIDHEVSLFPLRKESPR